MTLAKTCGAKIQGRYIKTSKTCSLMETSSWLASY